MTELPFLIGVQCIQAKYSTWEESGKAKWENGSLAPHIEKLSFGKSMHHLINLMGYKKNGETNLQMVAVLS